MSTENYVILKAPQKSESTVKTKQINLVFITSISTIIITEGYAWPTLKATFLFFHRVTERQLPAQPLVGFPYLALSGQILDTKSPFCAPLWRSCFSVPDTTRSTTSAFGKEIGRFLDSKTYDTRELLYVSEARFCVPGWTRLISGVSNDFTLRLVAENTQGVPVSNLPPLFLYGLLQYLHSCAIGLCLLGCEMSLDFCKLEQIKRCTSVSGMLQWPYSSGALKGQREGGKGETEGEKSSVFADLILTTSPGRAFSWNRFATALLFIQVVREPRKICGERAFCNTSLWILNTSSMWNHTSCTHTYKSKIKKRRKRWLGFQF